VQQAVKRALAFAVLGRPTARSRQRGGAIATTGKVQTEQTAQRPGDLAEQLRETREDAAERVEEREWG
jgi:hypothetical protein